MLPPLCKDIYVVFAADVIRGCSTQLCAKLIAFEQLSEGVRQRFGISGWNEEPGLTSCKNFLACWNIAGDNGNTHRHGFNQSDAKTFITRCAEGEDIYLPEQSGDIGSPAEKFCTARYPETSGMLDQRPVQRAIADDPQFCLGFGIAEQRESPQQRIVILYFVEPRDHAYNLRRFRPDVLSRRCG